MEEELKKRIAELREKLDNSYITKDRRQEIERDLDILLCLQRALYSY